MLISAREFRELELEGGEKCHCKRKHRETLISVSSVKSYASSINLCQTIFLLCLTSLVCLSSNPEIHCLLWGYLSPAKMISAPLTRAGSPLVAAAATVVSSAQLGLSDQTTTSKLVRLAGEQAQFECQLSPLANLKSVDNQDYEQSDEAPVGTRQQRGVTGFGAGGQHEDGPQLTVVGGLQDGALIDESRARATTTSPGKSAASRRSARNPGQELLMEPPDDGGGDSVELILWYHDSESKLQPIYSVDARQMILSQQPSSSSSSWPASRLEPGSSSTVIPSNSSGLVPVVWRQQVQPLDGEGGFSGDNGANRHKQLAPSPGNGGISIIESSSSSSYGEQLNYSSASVHGSSSAGVSMGDQQQYSPYGRRNSDLLRNVISGNSKHYAQAKLASRTRMLIRGTSAHLIIDRVEPADSGQYKCRVDFRFARTRYQLAHLDVIAPVTLLQIRATDERGIDLWPAAGINSTWSPQLAKQWAPTRTLATNNSRAAPDPMQSHARRHQTIIAAIESPELDGGQRLKYNQPQQQPRHRLHHHHSGLNHDPLATGQQPKLKPAMAEHKFVGLVQANEDETMNFECAVKDGWPKTRMGLWRADWPQVPLDPRRPLNPRLRPLRLELDPERANNSLSARVAILGSERFGQQLNGDLIANSGGQHSINTTSSMAADQPDNAGRASGRPAWPAQHVTQSSGSQDPSTTTTSSNGLNTSYNYSHNDPPKTGGGPSNVNSSGHEAREQEHDKWLAWMTNHLVLALLKFGQNLDKQVSSDLVHGLDGALAATDGEADGWVDGPRPEMGRPATVLSSASASSNTLAAAHGELEFRRLLLNNDLILYVCGASNTLVQQYDQLQSDLSQRQRDKLANIRPVFTSIFVRSNARPKWIQMFLVGRRTFGGHSSGKLAAATEAKLGHIELTPLASGQKLQLNLDPFGKGERQLQFACQVGGSLPEAKLVWTRTYNGRGQATKSGPLASEDQNDGRYESLSLIQQQRGSASASAAPPEVVVGSLEDGLAHERIGMGMGRFRVPTGNYSSNFSADHHNGRPTQWSLLRLHNISLTDHQTVITCSAFNERFIDRGDNSGLYRRPDGGSQNVASFGSHRAERDSKLSTFVRLNITHVPVLELELELNQRAGESNFARNNNSSMDPSSRESPGPTTTTTTTTDTNLADGSWRPANDDKLAADSTGNNNSNENSNQIKPILYGQNVTLVCGVAFANPTISQPGIEWLLNDTRLILNGETLTSGNPVIKLVRWIQLQTDGQLEKTNKYHFYEKLIVQFVDIPQYDGQEIQLKCQARNAIGQASSNMLRIVIGQLPHCPSQSRATTTTTAINRPTAIISNNSNNDKRDYITFDNNLLVHCPVISDKSSSIFHWLVESKSGGQRISHSKTDHIEVSKLNLPANVVETGLNQDNGDNNNNNNNNNDLGFKISCSASDKFGSNHNSACQVVKQAQNSILPAKEDDETINRSTTDYNCAAKVLQRNLVHKRQQPRPQYNNLVSISNKDADNQPINTINHQQLLSNESDTNALATARIGGQLVVASTKARLLISIECKDNNQFKVVEGISSLMDIIETDYGSETGRLSGGSSLPGKSHDQNAAAAELIHFDLYHKRNASFIKHLASYPNRARGNNNNNDNNGLGLMFDLGNELESMPLDDIEKDHFIVMSITDANNNKLIKPNVSLQFNTRSSEGKFITSDHRAGQRDRSSMQLLLASSSSSASKQNGLAGTQTVAADRFPRTSDSGHQDRLWIIGSMLGVFLGSFVLVIVAWVCKSSSTRNNKSNNKSQGFQEASNHLGGFKGVNGTGSSNSSGNSSNTGASIGSTADSSAGAGSNRHGANGHRAIDSSTATELYLMGRNQVRLAREDLSPCPVDFHGAFQNQRQEWHNQMAFLADHQGSLLRRTLISSSQAAPNTFGNFLVIDPMHDHQQQAKSPLTDSESCTLQDNNNNINTSATSAAASTTTDDATKQSAILLIDPASDSITCSSAYENRLLSRLEVAPTGPLSSQHSYYHLDPVIRVHPVGGHQDATLRALDYCGGRLVSQSGSSNSGRNSTRAGGSGDASQTTNGPQTRSLWQQQHHHHRRSPPINVATVAPSPGIGPNFELNSQGELTMTDSSCSFVHDDSTTTTTAIERLACPTQCPLADHGARFASGTLADFSQPQGRQNYQNSNCLECQHQIVDWTATGGASLVRVIETDLDGNNGNLFHPSEAQYPSAGQQKRQQQVSLASTLKRSIGSGDSGQASGTKRAERVRFVDYQFEHDSSCL